MSIVMRMRLLQGITRRMSTTNNKEEEEEMDTMTMMQIATEGDTMTIRITQLGLSRNCQHLIPLKRIIIAIIEVVHVSMVDIITIIIIIIMGVLIIKGVIHEVGTVVVIDMVLPAKRGGIVAVAIGTITVITVVHVVMQVDTPIAEGGIIIMVATGVKRQESIRSTIIMMTGQGRMVENVEQGPHPTKDTSDVITLQNHTIILMMIIRHQCIHLRNNVLRGGMIIEEDEDPIIDQEYNAWVEREGDKERWHGVV